MSSHLRRNFVAYVALAVALTTGSAYAATELPKKLPKHSVGAKQLKKSAVTSKAVKDGSLTAADLAAGTVPGAAWVGADQVAGVTAGYSPTPGAFPDQPRVQTYNVTLPRAGTLLVNLANQYFTGGCPGGSSAVIGLYLDNAPIGDTALGVDDVERPAILSGTVAASAGHHELSLGYDCPLTSAGYTGYSYRSYTWSVVLAP